MRDRELSQYIEQLIEVKNMEMEQEPQNEETNLIPRAPEVISQSPPPTVLELVLMMILFSLMMIESWMCVVYHLTRCRRRFYRCRGSTSRWPRITFIHQGKGYNADTKKHPTVLAESSLAYVWATHTNIKYLMTENEQLTKNLQVVRQEVEKIRAST